VCVNHSVIGFSSVRIPGNCFMYWWDSWVDYVEIVSDHKACFIFSYASHLLYTKRCSVI